MFLSLVPSLRVLDDHNSKETSKLKTLTMREPFPTRNLTNKGTITYRNCDQHFDEVTMIGKNSDWRELFLIVTLIGRNFNKGRNSCRP